jgi:hypothetical protein
MATNACAENCCLDFMGLDDSDAGLVDAAEQLLENFLQLTAFKPTSSCPIERMTSARTRSVPSAI